MLSMPKTPIHVYDVIFKNFLEFSTNHDTIGSPKTVDIPLGCTQIINFANRIKKGKFFWGGGSSAVLLTRANWTNKR